MMEQMEFDCRLDSERELQENINIALEFACKQLQQENNNKVQNRHDGYGIASEYYATIKGVQKKVDDSMKYFLSILPSDEVKAVEAASSLKNAATQLVIAATKLAAQAERIMNDLYDGIKDETTLVEDYLSEFEEADEDVQDPVEDEPEENIQEEDE